jgi:uncharacterized protein (DUF1800 family)
MASDPTSAIAHLYRRAGFGITSEQAAGLAVSGYAAAVDQLLDRSRPDASVAAVFDPQLPLSNYLPNETIEERKAKNQIRREQRDSLIYWWLQRMAVAENPLPEKMTLFWHGHFATSSDKVREPAFMLQQNQAFRLLGMGSFEPLVQTIAKDPAMMIWLDSNQNRKGSPNENFARELMELFTIGIGSYTDAEVREAARAFTGWRISNTGVFTTQPGQMDRGTKSLLGRSGNLTGEDVANLLAKHPAAARFVTAKLWSRFAYPVQPDSAVVNDLSPAFAADGDITTLLRSIFNHSEFVSPNARSGLVKQPIEYVVGALRALGLRPDETTVTGPNLINMLTNLNQVPFDPPSVGGWPQNGYWLSTSTSLARVRFANALARRANLSWLNGTTPDMRADQIVKRLGIDGFTASSRRAVVSGSSPIEQVALALVTPEYILN